MQQARCYERPLALLPISDAAIEDVWHTGASAHFLDNPLQRIKRDVDVLAGHVVFDYDTSRELAGALILGLNIPRTAMV